MAPVGKIEVTTESLKNASKEVNALANEYEREWRQLYITVDALEAAWSGVDNKAFTEQIKGFRDDFQRMTQLMKDYADYLEHAGSTYYNTQDDIKNNAKSKLSTGN